MATAEEEKRTANEKAANNNDEMEISTSDSDNQIDEELNFVLDVPMRIAAELGSLQLRIRELMGLEVGSVLEMEKLAGEPLEILVNEKLICRGEVIVINEKYGIRMTDIVDPSENIEIKSKPTHG
jgi:flagellar motor switch protein FliN/FliY